MDPKTVVDRTLEFLLVHESGAALPDLASLAGLPFPRAHWRDAFDDEQADERQKVWALKSSLDAIDPTVYTQTRNRLFPLASSGMPTGQSFFNRAGHKLLESMEATGVWTTLTASQKSNESRKRRRGHNSLVNAVAFADVCGGPGAFSQALYATAPKYKLRLRGYGMTLGNVEGLDWYPELLRRHGLTPTYGVDCTGDIFQLANIDALATVAQGSDLRLVVADGGFNVEFSRANYQETISARILYAQWLSAIKLLRRGGSFVLKLFDSFSPLTRSLLFLSTFLFERVHIVKPKHSRVVNSERYLVCIGFLGAPSQEWLLHFDECFRSGFADNDTVPELFPAAWMAADAAFMDSIRTMNTTIAKNQQVALRMILDEVNGSAAPKPLSDNPSSPTADQQAHGATEPDLSKSERGDDALNGTS